MKICIVADQKKLGRKGIEVDGKIWGWFRPINHGSKGVEYEVVQDREHRAIRRAGDESKSRHSYPVLVPGDAMMRRRHPKEPVAPLPERMREMAEELIKDGKLIDPDVALANIRAEREAHEAKDRAKKERVQLHRLLKLEGKADEVYAVVAAGQPAKVVKQAIVAAMQWAQNIEYDD